MLCAIDIGNSNIVIAFYKDDKLLSFQRVKTDLNITSDEYAVLLRNLLILSNTGSNEIEGAIVSSVVPSLNTIIKRAIKLVFGVNAIIVGPGIKTGLNIKIDDPSQLGSDFVCSAVGAIANYPLPAVVVDLGTASKFSAIDKNGNFRGGTISPGIKLSLNALAGGTSLLPQISLESPPGSVIGTNTVDSMKAGIIYGSAKMIDGILDMYRKELGENMTVIATGGLAEFIIPYCKHEIISDEYILLDGLRVIYDKNMK